MYFKFIDSEIILVKKLGNNLFIYYLIIYNFIMSGNLLSWKYKRKLSSTK